MGRTAIVRFQSLKNCLINLPLSIYGPLVERGVAPQSLVIELTVTARGAAKKGSSTKHYVGWTGMSSSVAGVSEQMRNGTTPTDIIEIDPQFASVLGGLTERTVVTIELLRDLPIASSVSVTPLTADDWEILETNADFVEGNLLSQVRAVKEGMVIGCWVGGTTLIKLTVDEIKPAASPALLLTSATELIVAPKTRRQAMTDSETNLKHDLSVPSHSDSNGKPSSSQSADWDALRRRLLRLLPSEFILSDTRGSEVATGEDASTTATAYVSPSLCRALERPIPSLRFTISHQARPQLKPSGSALEGRPEHEKHNHGASTTSANNGGKVGREVRRVEVRFKESIHVPKGHIWVDSFVRHELGLIDDSHYTNDAYEMIKLGHPLSAAAKKAKVKEIEQQSLTPIASSIGSTLPRPSLLHHKNSSSGARGGLRKATSSAIAPFTELAGVDDKISSIESHIVNSLAAKRLGSKMLPALGILVTGSSGAGKTVLAQRVARDMERDPRALTHSLYVDCSKYTDERVPTLKSRFKDWFDAACWHAPSLVVLDNLDRMLGAEVEHADSFSALHLAHTFLAVARPALAASDIILVATSQSATSLHPLLSTTHLLGETIFLRGPGKAGRRDILKVLINSKSSKSDLTYSELNFATIAGQTEGYLPADLRDLVDRAIHQAAIRSISERTRLNLQLEDFTSAQIGFVPLSLRDVKLRKSDVQWADIGGLHETRRTLRETLEWPTKYGAIFANCPLRLRSGLLLYGFPGCGKTLLASAVAKECGLNFISVKGPEILNKYIGASEKSVRDLFERAQAAKPCILFFDEFDSIAPKRGHDSTGVTDRVVNQMLTQMDGAEGLDGVYVLAATSRPDLIDPALLRPGRLDKSLLCDMPNQSDRLEIMQACSRKISLSPSVILEEYAAKTKGFSGADLQALIYNAHLDAIHATLSETVDGTLTEAQKEQADISYLTLGGAKSNEKVLSRAEQAAVNKRLELILGSLTINKGGDTKKAKAAASQARQPTHVTSSHLDQSLASTRPSVPADELVRLQRIYSEFVSGRSPNGLPSGEASDAVGGRSSLM